MVGIYLVTNIANQKHYIGQSNNIKRRWRDHRTRPFTGCSRQYNCLFYRAIRKYGLDNFHFEILEECDKSLLNEREQYYIHKYKSDKLDYGYNLTSGGYSGNTFKLSDDMIVNIQDELLHSALNQMEIANQYNVSQIAISDINIGDRGKDDSLDYPLRKRGETAWRKHHEKIKYELYAQHKIGVCIDCCTKISPDAIRCVQCNTKLQRVCERPSRDELKDLIRTSNFVAIGQQYGVTDNTIRKWCKAVNLPTHATEIRQYTDDEWVQI